MAYYDNTVFSMNEQEVNPKPELNIFPLLFFNYIIQGLFFFNCKLYIVLKIHVFSGGSDRS